MDVNMDRLNQFMGKMVTDIGAAANAALIRTGDRLGLYKALASKGPMTPAELAQATGTTERYVREWLSGATTKSSACSGTGDGVRRRRQPGVHGPIGDMMAAIMLDEPKVSEAFKSGKGVGWNDRAECLFCGTARFFRTGYKHHWCRNGCRRSTASWRKARTRRQGRRCRLRPRNLDAADGQGLPNSQFLRLRCPSGLDRRAPSRRSGSEALEPARHLRVADRQDVSGATTTIWSASSIACTTWAILSARCSMCARRRAGGDLHAGRAVRAGRLEDNLNPVGRLYLRGVHHGLHASVAGPGGRPRARRAGRRGQAQRGRRGCRFLSVTPRGGDAV